MNIIKDLLNKPDLNDFKASEGWLDKWKLNYKIREKQISGESLDVSDVTGGPEIEQLRELYKEYQSKDIWKVDKNGRFLKALPTKRPARNGVKCKGGKKSKQIMTVVFFISVKGKNYLEKQKPCCFFKAQMLHQNLDQFFTLQRESLGYKLIS